MATVSKSLNLLVDCLICELDMVERNPRQLSCKHSFCEECLSRTASLLQEDKLQCPVCLKHTQIPEKRIQNLPAATKIPTIKKALDTMSEICFCALCALRGEKSKAVARCSSCDFRVCKTCAEFHISDQKNSTHVIIYNLCKFHIRDISHGCLTCRSGLCFECLASGFHEDHDVCDITEIKDKVNDMMADGKNVLSNDIDNCNRSINKIYDESMAFIKQRRRETGEQLKNCIDSMLTSFNEMMNAREEKHNKALTSALCKRQEACSLASNCLNEVNSQATLRKLENLDQLVQQTSGIFKTISAIRKNQSIPVCVPELDGDYCFISKEEKRSHLGISCMLGGIVRSSSEIYESKPKERFSVYELPPRGEYFNSLRYISTLPDGSAVLGIENCPGLIQVNLEKVVTSRYSTNFKGCCRGTCIDKGVIYIGTENGERITVVSGFTEKSILLQPGLQNMMDLAVDEESLLLIDGNHELWLYSVDGKRLDERPLSKADRISVGVHPTEGKVYLVSVTDQQELGVYRPDGQLIRTIGGKGTEGGQFTGIGGSVMLPNGRILITDYYRNLVSEFTIEGDFIRQMLTGTDGLYGPWDLAFVYPNLWIACYKKAMLFTYS